VLAFQYVTTRTRFGRHIFASAATRSCEAAGISLSRTRIGVFMLASSMAAVGGILAASRLLAVSQSSAAAT